VKVYAHTNKEIDENKINIGTIAIRVVEFSNGGYKIREVFA
jgi:hypothetical protein